MTDLHGKKSSKENLGKLLESDYDLLLILGDITQFGPVSHVGEVLDFVEQFDLPVYSILGNCDPPGAVDLLENRGVSLHSKVKSFGGLKFVGLGGSNDTPFDTPFELSEAEIGDVLEGLTKNLHGEWILVTHAPPYGTKADKTSEGTHAGSKSIRRIIKSKPPLVNFCGHIHEARSVDTINDTKIVNPGPLGEGYAVKLVYEDEIEIELLKV